MDKTTLGDRMKKNYENITRYYLTRRTPVIIRIDGKAFHSFTKGMDKPFDHILSKSMQDTMRYLCQNVQGCVLGYTQSDEISLLLTDYAEFETDAWFGNNLQKMCSVAASMATMAFNNSFENNVCDCLVSLPKDDDKQHARVYDIYGPKLFSAMFDARCFNIPKEEVCNYFIWRQRDATRNSIQSVGQANYSHKELQGKNCNDIQEMLFEDKGINWSETPTMFKRGSCCVKEKITLDLLCPTDSEMRTVWKVDMEIPIFSKERSYIERVL